MFEDRLQALESDIGAERAYAMALRQLELNEERKRQSGPGGLLHFIRYFWHLVEPTKKFVEGWALEAMCKHLEAVDEGRIQKLLITVPPGAMKSLLCSVFFPLWQWGPRAKAEQRFLNFAYAAHLPQRDNGRMLQILQTKEWRELWGKRRYRDADGTLLFAGFELAAEGKEKIATSKTGWKFATSVGGVGTGERADCVILDDPHSIKDDTSEVVRPETVRWFKEAMSNRLNDMERSSIIAIMQRSHEADVAGTILDDDMGYVHLNIPMEYEADQHCTTYTDDGKLFWTDPRKVEGECFWPERFPPKAVEDIKKLGAHVWISQYQQRPEPRGGAIIKRAYWRNYEVPDKGPRKGKWPEFEYVVVSIDSAFTEKTENDPTGMSAWGVWQNPEGSMCVMLLNAWRKWLTLNGTARRKLKTESWGDYRAETEETWGLVQWTRYECSRHKADALLIENKANGIDLQNEVIRLSQHDPWSIVMIDPKNLDKIARLRRIESVFAEGLVYAILEKAYAKLAIDEMAAAPRGRFRDITDSASQAINYLRKCGYLEHVDVFKERQVREQERRGRKPKGQAPLYPA